MIGQRGGLWKDEQFSSPTFVSAGKIKSYQCRISGDYPDCATEVPPAEPGYASSEKEFQLGRKTVT